MTKTETTETPVSSSLSAEAAEFVPSSAPVPNSLNGNIPKQGSPHVGPASASKGTGWKDKQRGATELPSFITSCYPFVQPNGSVRPPITRPPINRFPAPYRLPGNVPFQGVPMTVPLASSPWTQPSTLTPPAKVMVNRFSPPRPLATETVSPASMPRNGLLPNPHTVPTLPQATPPLLMNHAHNGPDVLYSLMRGSDQPPPLGQPPPPFFNPHQLSKPPPHSPSTQQIGHAPLVPAHALLTRPPRRPLSAQQHHQSQGMKLAGPRPAFTTMAQAAVNATLQMNSNLPSNNAPLRAMKTSLSSSSVSSTQQLQQVSSTQQSQQKPGFSSSSSSALTKNMAVSSTRERFQKEVAVSTACPTRSPIPLPTGEEMVRPVSPGRSTQTDIRHSVDAIQGKQFKVEREADRTSKSVSKDQRSDLESQAASSQQPMSSKRNSGGFCQEKNWRLSGDGGNLKPDSTSLSSSLKSPSSSAKEREPGPSSTRSNDRKNSLLKEKRNDGAEMEDLDPRKRLYRKKHPKDRARSPRQIGASQLMSRSSSSISSAGARDDDEKIDLHSWTDFPPMMSSRAGAPNIAPSVPLASGESAAIEIERSKDAPPWSLKGQGRELEDEKENASGRLKEFPSQSGNALNATPPTHPGDASFPKEQGSQRVTGASVQHDTLPDRHNHHHPHHHSGNPLQGSSSNSNSNPSTPLTPSRIHSLLSNPPPMTALATPPPQPHGFPSKPVVNGLLGSPVVEVKNYALAAQSKFVRKDPVNTHQSLQFPSKAPGDVSTRPSNPSNPRQTGHSLQQQQQWQQQQQQQQQQQEKQPRSRHNSQPRSSTKPLTVNQNSVYSADSYIRPPAPAVPSSNLVQSPPAWIGASNVQTMPAGHPMNDTADDEAPNDSFNVVESERSKKIRSKTPENKQHWSRDGSAGKKSNNKRGEENKENHSNNGSHHHHQEEDGSGVEGDGQTRRRRRRNRGRSRSGKGTSDRGRSDQSGDETRGGIGSRAVSSSNVSEMTLHFEDVDEFPDLMASSRTALSQQEAFPSFGVGERSTLSGTSLSYSDAMKSFNHSRPHSLTGSCVSADNDEDEGSNIAESKRARKRRKRREQANQAAETELAEISLEQRLLKEGLKKSVGAAPGLISESSIVREAKKPAVASGKKSKEPITLSIAAMLDAIQKKTDELPPPSLATQMSSTLPKKGQPPKVVKSSGGKPLINMLDASAPVQKRGKEREIAKPKKPSPLKKVILKEREEKKRMRLLDGKDDIMGSTAGVGMLGDESELSQDAMSCKSDASEGQEQLEGAELSADLSPISQTSPIPMSPASPGNSGMNSPVAGSGRDPVVMKIHSRRFREYCTQVLDKEIDQCCTALLQDLVRFQDRMYHKDPVKAKTKRRLVLGLREVTKHLRLKKIKCVVISPNLEKIQSKGGLDEALNKILTMCQEQDVPFVFALGRRALGRACAKLVPVSVVGIFNFDGCEDKYHTLISLTDNARSTYHEMVEAVEREVAQHASSMAWQDASIGSVSSLLPAHMGHSRTPSGCSAISFTSSIVSEPHSEFCPSYADDQRFSDVNTGARVSNPANDTDDGNEADTEDFGDAKKKRRVLVRGGNSVRFGEGGGVGSEDKAMTESLPGNSSNANPSLGTNGVTTNGSSNNNNNSTGVSGGNSNNNNNSTGSSAGGSSAAVDVRPHILHHNLHHHRRQSSISSLARINEGVDDEVAAKPSGSTANNSNGNPNSDDKLGDNSNIEKSSTMRSEHENLASGASVLPQHIDSIHSPNHKLDSQILTNRVVARQPSWDFDDDDVQDEDSRRNAVSSQKANGVEGEQVKDEEDDDNDGDEEDLDDEEEDEDGKMEENPGRRRGHLRQRSMDKKERIKNWLESQSNIPLAD